MVKKVSVNISPICLLHDTRKHTYLHNFTLVSQGGRQRQWKADDYQYIRKVIFEWYVSDYSFCHRLHTRSRRITISLYMLSLFQISIWSLQPFSNYWFTNIQTKFRIYNISEIVIVVFVFFPTAYEGLCSVTVTQAKLILSMFKCIS